MRWPPLWPTTNVTDLPQVWTYGPAIVGQLRDRFDTSGDWKTLFHNSVATGFDLPELDVGIWEQKLDEM